MNACFLETSAVIDLARSRPGVLAVASLYKQHFLSPVALGELVAGAYTARDPQAEMERLKGWVSDFQIIRADEQTAYVYGELQSDLRRQGKPIPTNDLWIAAAAIQYDLPLIARDAHFARLPRLRLVGY